MGFIYKIINKVNGKCYIGQTKRSIEERWRDHKKNNSNCIYLKRAFSKYDISNFCIKIICICFDDDLNRFEEDYIKLYDTLSPKGYNLKSGGNNSKMHDETKQKISNTLKNNYKSGKIIIKKISHPHTLETKEKISKSLKGRKIENPKYGNFLKDDSKDKIRHKAKNRERFIETNLKISESLKKTNENSLVKLTVKREVIKYDINNNYICSYVSLTEASKLNNVSKSAISYVCNGKNKTCNGFVWKFK